MLPDWRPALTPPTLRPASSVMSVRYRGVTHRITYTPSPDGLQQFLEALQAIGIKVSSPSQVTFLCRAPDTGAEMALSGLQAFDAAALNRYAQAYDRRSFLARFREEITKALDGEIS